MSGIATAGSGAKDSSCCREGCTSCRGNYYWVAGTAMPCSGAPSSDIEEIRLWTREVLRQAVA